MVVGIDIYFIISKFNEGYVLCFVFLYIDKCEWCVGNVIKRGGRCFIFK